MTPSACNLSMRLHRPAGRTSVCPGLLVATALDAVAALLAGGGVAWVGCGGPCAGLGVASIARWRCRFPRAVQQADR